MDRTLYDACWVLDVAVFLIGVRVLILAVDRPLTRPVPPVVAPEGLPSYPDRSVVVDGYTRPSATMMALVDRHDDPARAVGGALVPKPEDAK